MALPAPLDRANLAYWKKRLSGVQAGDAPRFGKLDPPSMMRHLRRGLEPATGDYDPEDSSNFLTRRSLVHVIFLRMPWPKGKIKGPDWLTPPAEGDLETERAALFATMDKFVSMLEKSPQTRVRNALLGSVTLEYTSRLTGKHLDHHAQQYGV